MKGFRFPGPLDHESMLIARLWDAGCQGVVEDGADVLAYFEQQTDLNGADRLLGRWEDVANVDHIAAYFAGLEPVLAGGLVIAPTHTQPQLTAYQQVVWLDPGSAFGTGHHETTRLALEALDGVGVLGRRVLDVGFGSGILTIAADRLGAALAIGVDIDAATLAVARHNAERNRSRARFLHGTLDHPELPAQVDVLVANLYAELHVGLLPSYAALVGAGGDLLLTGILASREVPLLDAIPTVLFRVGVARDGEWVLVHLRKRAS